MPRKRKATLQGATSPFRRPVVAATPTAAVGVALRCNLGRSVSGLGIKTCPGPGFLSGRSGLAKQLIWVNVWPDCPEPLRLWHTRPSTSQQAGKGSKHGNETAAQSCVSLAQLARVGVLLTGDARGWSIAATPSAHSDALVLPNHFADAHHRLRLPFVGGRAATTADG